MRKDRWFLKKIYKNANTVNVCFTLYLDVILSLLWRGFLVYLYLQLCYNYIVL